VHDPCPRAIARCVRSLCLLELAHREIEASDEQKEQHGKNERRLNKRCATLIADSSHEFAFCTSTSAWPVMVTVLPTIAPINGVTKVIVLVTFTWMVLVPGVNELAAGQPLSAA
jgi:hypothetical protein